MLTNTESSFLQEKVLLALKCSGDGGNNYRNINKKKNQAHFLKLNIENIHRYFTE